jgi:ABC-type multidrug transport system fused ATPase/permease subunit
MEGFLKLGFFSMADKVTDALGKSFPYILTGAVIAAIWIYFLLIVPRKTKRYDSFLEYAHDILNFRTMLTSGLFKILYMAFAIVILITGFVAMFAANFMVGLVGLIILEIILRVIFELVMVLFSIQENLVAIRERRKAEEEAPDTEDEDED